VKLGGFMEKKKVKTIDELIQNEFDEALGKIGLSFIALLVLVIFFNAIDALGLQQTLALFVLHVISLILLGKAYKPRNINQAIVGLSFGLLWNIGFTFYIIYLHSEAITYSSSYFTIDTRPPQGALAATGFLAFWFAKSIYKLHSLKKKKFNSNSQKPEK
jgi:hypothetical protein